MKIRILSIGTRQPAWVTAGYDAYAKRLPKDTRLILEEIPSRSRRGADAARCVIEEGEALLARVKPDERVIVLDEGGRPLTSQGLGAELDRWRRDGRDVALLIGGADGLSAACLARAEWCWSLSSGTFPHGLVRVMVAEQIYRAWTLLTGHPYHRA